MFPAYGTGRAIIGDTAWLAAALASQTWDNVNSSVVPVDGGILLPRVTDTTQPATAMDDALYDAVLVWEHGLAHVYKIIALWVGGIAGASYLSGDGLTCTSITAGALATTVFGNPVSASTLGGPSVLQATLPGQVDAGATGSPCDSVPGGSYRYDIPSLYLMTVTLTPPRGITEVAAPEITVALYGSVAGAITDTEGVAGCIAQAGLPDWIFGIGAVDTTTGLAPLAPNRVNM